MSELHSYLHENGAMEMILSLTCIVDQPTTLNYFTVELKPAIQFPIMTSVLTDMKNLYLTGDLSDFTIIASTGHKFPVHKCVLAGTLNF